MTNPKTDHKIKHQTANAESGSGRPAAAHESQTDGAHRMAEACERLGSKLDELAAMMSRQIEAWKQSGEADTGTPSGLKGPAAGGEAMEQVPVVKPTAHQEPAGQGAGVRENQQENGAAAPGNGSLPPAGESARRLMDALSRSRNDWQEQMAGAQQALEAIMDYLERQAGDATPRLEAAEIMSRLKELEEQQRALQSQIQYNR